MEELPALKKMKLEIEADWSPTLKQKDSDDCVVCRVFSYGCLKFLRKKLGYGTRVFNVYFVGNAIHNLPVYCDSDPSNSPQVEFYDTHSMRWRREQYPDLRDALFVFFLDEQLYVLSTKGSSPHFERLDTKDISQHWDVLQDEASSFLIWKSGWVCLTALIVMGEAILKKKETFEVLPHDYNNWSSTVIFFEEKNNDISVFAFNSDDCTVYFVVSYQVLYGHPNELGCTAADFKVYFVGGNDGYDSLNVYDVCNRRWMTEEYPKLNAPKPHPFVFFHDGRLYVLSASVPCRDQTHFEMLDLNNLSQGWVFLPEPSFTQHPSAYESACLNISIVDYSEKMLYVRLIHNKGKYHTDLYGYCIRDNEWHEPVKYAANLTARTRNLLMVDMSMSWPVIVENYLYRFELLEYPDGLRAILIIHDLNHDNAVGRDRVDDIHDYDGRNRGAQHVEGIWKVDISSVVAPDVYRRFGSYGFLVYQGKRNSRQRFSLLVKCRTCESCSDDSHLCTCTFDLRRSSKDENSADSFSVDAVCCQYRHIKVDGIILSCHKLYEVKDDCTSGQ